MTSAEELHMKAEAYRQAALDTKDDDSRKAYLSLMAAWREITPSRSHRAPKMSRTTCVVDARCRIIRQSDLLKRTKLFSLLSHHQCSPRRTCSPHPSRFAKPIARHIRDQAGYLSRRAAAIFEI
jgi:hypothetical protein